MNKGFILLLQSMGIKIDPAEIEQAWDKSKNALPELAKAFDAMDKRQARLEEKMDELLARSRVSQTAVSNESGAYHVS